MGKYFFQFLTVPVFNEMRQTEIHTAEPRVPKPSTFEFELTIENLKGHQLPGTDQIPAQLLKTRGKTIHCDFHNIIISVWNKEELPVK